MPKIEVTEKAYILIADLAAAEFAKDIVRNILPENNSFIDADEYRIVIITLRKWIDTMRENLDVYPAEGEP